MTPIKSGVEPTQNTKESFLTIKQAAEYLHFNPSTIRSYIRNGKLTAFRVQGSQHIVIPVAAINALLAPAAGEAK